MLRDTRQYKTWQERLVAPVVFIEDFLGQRVKNTNRENVLVKCPLHGDGQEKHPSMSINLLDGRYVCFTCHAKGGNIADLHSKITGRSFMESVHALSL